MPLIISKASTRTTCVDIMTPKGSDEQVGNSSNGDDRTGSVREVCIPANFFWDISVRYFRRFPKIPEEVRSIPKTSEVFRSLRTSINASSLPVLFPSKIRDREEKIVIYEFYTWFSFLTWVWVNIFLEIVSSKIATTHIFQPGVRNWPVSVSRREIEAVQPAGVRLAPKAWWELAGISLFRGPVLIDANRWTIFVWLSIDRYQLTNFIDWYRLVFRSSISIDWIPRVLVYFKFIDTLN